MPVTVHPGLHDVFVVVGLQERFEGGHPAGVAAKDGGKVTSRELSARLDRELLTDVSLRVESAGTADAFIVSGRGELHLAVLVERAHPELHELLVSAVQLRAGGADDQSSDPALIDKVVAEADALAADLDLSSLSDPRPPRVALGLGVLATAATLLTLTVQEDAARIFLSRQSNSRCIGYRCCFGENLDNAQLRDRTDRNISQSIVNIGQQHFALVDVVGRQQTRNDWRRRAWHQRAGICAADARIAIDQFPIAACVE